MESLTLCSSFLSVSGLYAQMDIIARTLSKIPHLTSQVTTEGSTVRGNEIRMIGIASTAKSTKLRSSSIVVSGMHGREWIAIAGNVCQLQYLAAAIEHLHKTRDDEMTKVLPQLPTSFPKNSSDHVFELAKQIYLGFTNLYILPVLNPDGYTYTRSTLAGNPMKEKTNKLKVRYRPRYWRKNRSGDITANRKSGVDLNRNFGVNGLSWGFGTNSTRSELYQGSSAFSELETQTLRNIMHRLSSKYREQNVSFGIVDLHCCMNKVLLPFLPKRDPFIINSHDIRNSAFDSTQSEETASDIVSAIATLEESIIATNTDSVSGCGNPMALATRETTYSSSNTGVALDWCVEFGGADLGYIVEVPGHCRKPSEVFSLVFVVREKHIPSTALFVSAATSQVVAGLAKLTSTRTAKPFDIKEQQRESDVFNRTKTHTPVEVDSTVSIMLNNQEGRVGVSVQGDAEEESGPRTVQLGMHFISLVLLLLLVSQLRYLFVKKRSNFSPHKARASESSSATPNILNNLEAGQQPNVGLVKKRRV